MDILYKLAVIIIIISSSLNPRVVAAFDSSIVHMQIVAHQDDDFLFMNPDIQNDISQKLGIVTV